MQHRHFAVIGDPISHSLSPLLHQTAFDICYPHNTPSYVAYHVTKEKLEDFIQMFRGQTRNTFKPCILPESIQASAMENILQERTKHPFPMSGLSVTLPHKKELMKYADVLSLEAKLAGAANTLYWHEGKLIADNTDIIGFLAPLKSLPSPRTALILGAGGAAAAALVGLLKQASSKQNMKNIQQGKREELYTNASKLEEIFICARNEDQAKELITHIKNTLNQSTTSLHTRESQEPTLSILPFSEREKTADLIINTIPASLGGQSFTPRINFENVKYAYDLLYAQTPFIKEAKKAGVFTITGEEMFLEQGAQQFMLWTQKRMPQEAFLAVQNTINR